MERMERRPYVKPNGEVVTVDVPVCHCTDRRGPPGGVCASCAGAIPSMTTTPPALAAARTGTCDKCGTMWDYGPRSTRVHECDVPALVAEIESLRAALRASRAAEQALGEENKRLLLACREALDFITEAAPGTRYRATAMLREALDRAEKEEAR